MYTSNNIPLLRAALLLLALNAHALRLGRRLLRVALTISLSLSLYLSNMYIYIYIYIHRDRYVYNVYVCMYV